MASAAARQTFPKILRLERDGELWLCTCGDERFHLGDLKGVRMLARLVAEPGREFHVLDLTVEGGNAGAIDSGDAGEMLDAQARSEYERRLEALRSEIEEARTWNDAGREERAREELETLAAELARACGLGGRGRRAAKAAERARVNVQRRLKDAVARVSTHHEAAGRHLERALRTGAFCVYDPYLSADGSRAAGCAAMRVHEGTAWFDWAATLPEFRRRGSQQALLARRIADGLEAGVRRFLTCTGEAVEGDPQHSFRNILRAGFRRSHARANWVNDPLPAEG